jgi:hypothetical protein
VTLLSSALQAASTVLVPLLDDVPMPSEVKPGWLALGLVVTLCAVTVLLWLSMRKQLGRIHFDEEPDGDTQPRDPGGHEQPDRPEER